MRAIVHEGKNGFEGLRMKEMEVREPAAGEVRIRLKVAGLNHRDLLILDRHQPTDPAVIVGSDGAGCIDAIGPGVQGIHIGDEVIVNPGLGWSKKSDVPPASFGILGFPSHGTFAEMVVVPVENVLPKPSALTWEEAGVLSLAALTAYRALFTRANVQPGMKVLIPGIGGGAALFLLPFAKAAGATVYVTSRSKEKSRRALELGADKALDSDGDWGAQLDGEKVDVVIESIGAATFQKSLDRLRTGGTIVTFGASAGDVVQLNVRDFFYGHHNLLGTTMGSAEEHREMLAFIERHRIRPVVDRIYGLGEYLDAFRRMDQAEQFGKIGFRIDG
ncbi:alcohol dehydrogenase [Paenibacillus darwinianus]|uniref:Alcohol dehydrogenase n=1 Tax=Paenibacillus darwinianus TaxID=1380763 RepID=A0A9W5W6E1_9BACL|nr:zinc-binding dehydrogenase [Paenibacillus darwinianus]EXX85326.1 alcohol dehydrogenase [Paenibacillus darwinianus]EXX86190.1 alcohol dehydrogenase [Paenibacillus darwinianus]EXX86512.1 alcohol dehydrogenase [Paenibacillus darwinianus]